MARGWESKSVESQMESAEPRRARAAVVVKTGEQIERERLRDSLELSRRRVVHDLETAKNPRYREILEASLRALDDRIAELTN